MPKKWPEVVLKWPFYHSQILGNTLYNPWIRITVLNYTVRYYYVCNCIAIIKHGVWMSDLTSETVVVNHSLKFFVCNYFSKTTNKWYRLITKILKLGKQIGRGICVSKFQFPNLVFEMFFLDSYNVVQCNQWDQCTGWDLIHIRPEYVSMYILCICVYSHINYSHGSLGDESQAQGAAFMYCAVI